MKTWITALMFTASAIGWPLGATAETERAEGEKGQALEIPAPVFIGDAFHDRIAGVIDHSFEVAYERTMARAEAETHLDSAVYYVEVIDSATLAALEREDRRGLAHLGLPVPPPMDKRRD